MNSDPTTSDTPPAATTATGNTAPARRQSTRRSTRTTPADDGNALAPDETTGDGPPRTRTAARRARRTTAAEEPLAPPVAAPVETTGAAPALGEVVVGAPDGVLNVPGDAVTVEEGGATTRAPRRRNRGNRGNRPAAVEAAVAETEAVAEGDVEREAVAVAEQMQEPVAAEALVGDDVASAIDTGLGGEAGTGSTGTSRRRRRRNRGGRGATDSAETTDLVEPDDALDDDVSTAPAVPEPAILAPGAAPASVPPSPAVLRRFDHRPWRDRGGRAPVARGAPGAFTATGPASASADPLPATTGPGIGVASPSPAAGLDQPAVTTAPPTTPVPFERSARGRRFGDRRPAVPQDEAATPSSPIAAEIASIVTPTQQLPRVTEAGAATGMSPVVTPAYLATPVASAPAPGAGGGVEEHLERLVLNQSALLQQQAQALQTLTATMAGLQKAIERMSTGGIAAGMPRAGLFVDAPNVVYAAENARVSIDYGRMLDFLGRGRELVHAIVYAPVTEDTDYRFENQRFVAPFLRKGYKMVTKPLKRFPDGTAKGNFDIELAIDIVTMSSRLDVVVLISGDSDFSRLIELIQSRGVRVEVVAFASNVSWELVQMADVFIDIGQYLHEFTPQ